MVGVIILIAIVLCFIIYVSRNFTNIMNVCRESASTKLECDEQETTDSTELQCDEQETMESIIGNENVVHKKSLEDNGEGFIMTFAKVWLILLIIGAVIIFIAGIVVANELFGYNWLIFLYFLAGSAIAVILGFLTYFTVKVYTNISRKATAIYQLLDDRLEKKE